jgi:hypothetical protein
MADSCLNRGMIRFFVILLSFKVTTKLKKAFLFSWP